MSSIDNKDTFPGFPNNHNTSDFDAEQLKNGTDYELRRGANPREANRLAMDNLSKDPWHYAESSARKIDKIFTGTGWLYKSVNREPAQVVTGDVFMNVIDMIEAEAPNVSEAKFNNLVKELSTGIRDKKITMANISNVFKKYKITASPNLQKKVFATLSKV